METTICHFTRLPLLLSAALLASISLPLQAQQTTISTATTVAIATSDTATNQYNITGAGALTIDVSSGASFTLGYYSNTTNAAINLAAATTRLTIQGSGTTFFLSNIRPAARGGAISMSGGVAILENVSFGDANNLGLGNSAQGAAALFMNTGTFILTNGGFYGNKGTGGQNGGAAYIAGANVLASMTNVVFEANEHILAPRVGGAIFANAGTTSLTNVRFGRQDDPSRANTADRGGAIFMDGTGRLEITNGRFYGNKAAPTNGGAIFLNAQTTGFLTNVVFEQNSAGSDSATGYGGALYVNLTTSTPFTLTSATFGFDGNPSRGNQAGAGGGAIYLQAGHLDITRAEFYGNYASGFVGRGGALYVGAGALSLLGGSIFKDNHVDGENSLGGAIYLGGGSISLNDAIFTGNISHNLGGAIAAEQNATLNYAATVSATHSGNRAATAAAGGFLHLANNAALNASIDTAATVTIGGMDAACDTLSSGTFTTPAININPGATAGTLILSKGDSSAYAATINVHAGRLLLADGAKLGGLINVAPGATFGGQGAIDVAFGENRHVNIATGGILQVGLDGATGGAHTLALTGSLALADGAFIIGDGILDTTGATLGATAHDTIIADIAAAKTLSMRGAISGPGGLVKSGAGILVLDSTLTNVSTVAITGGTLAGTLSSVPSISITGTSVYDGSLARGASQSLTVAAGTITGTLSLTQGALLNIDLSTSVSSQLALGTLNAAGVTTVDFTNIRNGSFTIISADDLLAAASNFTYTVNGATLTGRNSIDFIFGANDISVYVTILNMRVTWDSPVGGIWDAASTNWSAVGDNRFANGDSARFAPAASGVITIIPEGVVAGDIEVSSTGVLTFTGGALATNAAAASVDGVPGLVSLGGGATEATTGKLVKKGTGTLVLANASGSFTGGVELDQGVLSFNHAAQLDTPGATITFTGAAQLRADDDITGPGGPLDSDITVNDGVAATLNTQSHTLEYTGMLSAVGAGASLIKTGAGSLVLRTTDNSAFAAPTTVSAGSLLLADGAKLGGPITVSSGAAVGGDGALGGNITINDGALLVGNAGATQTTLAPGTLNIAGDLALNSSSRVDFGIHAGGFADTLNVTGLITTAPATNTVGLSFALIHSGTYILGNATALAGINNLEINGVRYEPSLRMNASLAVDAGNLTFIYETDASRHMEWTGTGGAARWDIALDNWQGFNGDTSGHLKYQDADTVRFATTAGTTIDILASVTVSDMLVDNAGALTFTGQAINTSTAVTGTLVTAPLGKLVKTGAGSLIFDNTANTFIGGVELIAGVLAFTHTAQLDTAGAGINFTGSGTLRTLAPMTISDTLTFSGAGAAPALDTGSNDITLAGRMAGTGTLSKLGTGTLVLSNTGNAATVGYHISEGALLADSSILKTARVTTAAAGTLVLDQKEDITYTPAISGPGAFEKRGAGVLTLAAALGNTGATRVAAGTLKTSANNQINAASLLVVGPGAMLDLRGTRQNSASLDLNGTLLMSATVSSNAGVIVVADYLMASQFVSGTGLVTVALTEAVPAQSSGMASVVLIESADNTAASLTFNVNGSAPDAIFGWAVDKDGGNYVLAQNRLVPMIPAVAGVNAAMLINAETTFDALTQQLNALRLNNGGGSRRGFDWWLNAAYRHDTIKETLYDGAQAITRGVQAGMSWVGNARATKAKAAGKSSWAAGVFIDLMDTHMRLAEAETSTTSQSGGVHATYQPNNAFHATAILRAGTGRHKLCVTSEPSVPGLTIGTSSVGALVELGYTIRTKSGWLVEPQAQVAWHATGVDGKQDAAHRVYDLGDIISFRERLGLQFSKNIEFRENLILRPSLRMAYNHEFKGVSSVTVRRYYGENRIRLRDSYEYTDDFSGGSFLVGGGATMRFGDKLEAWTAFSTKLGGKLEDYTINLGIAWHW